MSPWESPRVGRYRVCGRYNSGPTHPNDTPSEAGQAYVPGAEEREERAPCEQALSKTTRVCSTARMQQQGGGGGCRISPVSLGCFLCNSKRVSKGKAAMVLELDAPLDGLSPLNPLAAQKRRASMPASARRRTVYACEVPIAAHTLAVQRAIDEVRFSPPLTHYRVDSTRKGERSWCALGDRCAGTNAGAAANGRIAQMLYWGKKGVLRAWQKPLSFKDPRQGKLVRADLGLASPPLENGHALEVPLKRFLQDWRMNAAPLQRELPSAALTPENGHHHDALLTETSPSSVLQAQGAAPIPSESSVPGIPLAEAPLQQDPRRAVAPPRTEPPPGPVLPPAAASAPTAPFPPAPGRPGAAAGGTLPSAPAPLPPPPPPPAIGSLPPGVPPGGTFSASLAPPQPGLPPPPPPPPPPLPTPRQSRPLSPAVASAPALATVEAAPPAVTGMAAAASVPPLDTQAGGDELSEEAPAPKKKKLSLADYLKKRKQDEGTAGAGAVATTVATGPPTAPVLPKLPPRADSLPPVEGRLAAAAPPGTAGGVGLPPLPLPPPLPALPRSPERASSSTTPPVPATAMMGASPSKPPRSSRWGPPTSEPPQPGTA